MTTNEVPGTSGLSGTSQLEAGKGVRAGLWSGIQARIGIGAHPAPDSRWDDFLQLAASVLVALLFFAFVAGPALNRYLVGSRLDHLPFTGLDRPSVESFIAVGLIIVMVVVLSRFPWFLYTSFQDTKKARIRGDTWLDMWALGYSTKLDLSGRAEKILTDYELQRKAQAGLGGKAQSSDAADKDRRGNSPGDAQDAERTPDLEHVKAAFFQRFEDSYGYGPFRGPLWSITMLYLIGWLMVLLPYGLSGQAPQVTAMAGMGGLKTLISHGMKDYVSAVANSLGFVTAAFLGAYIFSITSLFRRYLRSDFKPTALTQACLRVVTAWIVGFLLYFVPIDLSHLPLSDAGRQNLPLLLAFFLGIFALNAVFILWELTVKTLPELTHFGRGLKPSSLTELDGLDAWHEDRLNEAGIDSVRGLANVDFLDLLIGVRMPTQTLVDWVDQALLRMHVSESTWSFLLGHTSIRTATDMLHFLDPEQDGEPAEAQEDCKARQTQNLKLANILAEAPDKDKRAMLTKDEIDMLKDVLGREPNLKRIKEYYRRQDEMARGKAPAVGW